MDAPLNRQITITADERDSAIERAAARGASWTGSRLFVALSAMLFGSAVFAYFYLHSLDSNTLWRAPGQRPSDFISVSVLGLVLAGTAAFWLYSRGIEAGRSVRASDWRSATVIATLFFLLAGGIQLWGMTRTGFAAGSSGYASVYTATMPIFAVYCIGTAYWLETLFARSVRVRWLLAPQGVNKDSAELVAFIGSAVGARLFVVFVAAVNILMFVLFSVLN